MKDSPKSRSFFSIANNKQIKNKETKQRINFSR